jgi:hypothetical protein
MRSRTIRVGLAALLAASAAHASVGCGSSDAPQAEGPGQAGDGGGSGGGSGGSSSGGSSGSSSGSDRDATAGGDAGNQGHPDGSGSDDGAPADDGPSGGDAGSDAPGCPPCGGSTPLCDQGACKTCTSTSGCTADAPVCDTGANGGAGQCNQVHVLAFYVPDPMQQDRAHAAYVRHANVWFPQQAADQKFFTFDSTTDWNQLKTITPAPGKVIMFLDDSPSDPGQRTGFQTYMENGGAWMGCHVSAYNDTSGAYNWDWYFKQLLGGGLFVSNTWSPTTANLDVDDPAHPLSQGLGTMFTSAPCEWYSWQVDLRTLPNIDILLSVDPSSFPLGTDPNQSWTSGYYPVAWTNKNYKMLYVNMGHEQMDYAADTALSSTFDSPTQNILYMNAFKWLGGAQL